MLVTSFVGMGDTASLVELPSRKRPKSVLTLFGWVNEVGFADGTSWNAAPAVVGTASNGDAPVQLSSPLIYLPLKECDDVTNISHRTITHLTLEFIHTSLAGSPLGTETIDMSGSLRPNDTKKALCRAFNGSIKPSLLAYGYARFNYIPVEAPTIYYDGQASEVHSVVREVDFSDGQSWKAQ